MTRTNSLFTSFLFYWIAALVCLLLSCNIGSEVTTLPRKKQLIIDFVDPSGTAIGAGWPNPSTQFYSDQISWLENNGGGILVVINTSLRIPQELQIDIKALDKVPTAVEVGEETVRKIMAANDSLNIYNTQEKIRFFSFLDSFIITYNPKKAIGGDLSFININLYALTKKIRDSSFSSYSRHVFIYSDLLDESGTNSKKPADSILIRELNNTGCDIAICSLLAREQENSSVKDITGVRLSSYQDFILHLNSLSLKQSV